MKIFCIVGRSSSGKDTICGRVKEEFGSSLKPIVTWTTRNRRKDEVDGVVYHFSNDSLFQKQLSEGKVVEYRVYKNIQGTVLTYYTLASNFDSKGNYLAVTSLSQVNKYADYFGCKNVYPIVIELEDRVLLNRALDRCEKTGESYKEVCRRYISDSNEWEKVKFNEDLSLFRVYNDDLDVCCSKVFAYIKEVMNRG